MKMGLDALSTAEIESLLPYMRDVTRCEVSLRELNLMWGLIEASAKMNCPQEARTILPTMAATRTQFGQMERELVTSLVHEKLRNVVDQLQTKARYVIDIVVRNLYERTADVGFLATDGELCAFLALDADSSAAQAESARQRLQEYRAKYTVYDDILLVDSAGQVRVNIDPERAVSVSGDPLLTEAAAANGFTETFRATDLRPGLPRALIYARRMQHPERSQTIGTLCLSFNFAQEMAGIFQSHGDASGRSVMLLLDEEHRVIASSDEVWMPIGVKVPVNLDGAARTMVHGGRPYLISTHRSSGYQGYPGPQGWLGQVMMPLDVAFDSRGSEMTDQLDPVLLRGLLSHAESFCPPLHDIVVAARRIQRIVWNGQVMTAGSDTDMSKLKTVLEQISETGHRSNQLFRASINELYQTVLATSLRDAGFTARLLVDLLDRNLYERADDCRWWALTPQLRQGLAEPSASAGETMTKVLHYINQLYTVYTRIFVYDTQGEIVASTGSALPPGSRVDTATLRHVLALRGSQSYHVSPFQPEPLYDGASTYVFHAAIRAPHDDSRVVGGIGIVFDSSPELLAMLRSGLGEREHMHALFVSRQGHVLTSTHPDHPVGSVFALTASLASVGAGEHRSELGLHAGEYAVMAASASAGYREFKTSDGYRDDVIAVVIRHFGEEREAGGEADVSAQQIQRVVLETPCVEYATFLQDHQVMGLPARHVLEAVSAQDIVPVSAQRQSVHIGMVRRQSSTENTYVWVFDLCRLMTGRAARISGDSQVLIVEVEGRSFGLLVDELHAVAEFADESVVRNPVMAAQMSQHIVTHIIKANQGALPILVLDPRRLARAVGLPESTLATEPA